MLSQCVQEDSVIRRYYHEDAFLRDPTLVEFLLEVTQCLDDLDTTRFAAVQQRFEVGGVPPVCFILLNASKGNLLHALEGVLAFGRGNQSTIRHAQQLQLDPSQFLISQAIYVPFGQVQFPQICSQPIDFRRFPSSNAGTRG